jgi:hypothetical protein
MVKDIEIFSYKGRIRSKDLLYGMVTVENNETLFSWQLWVDFKYSNLKNVGKGMCMLSRLSYSFYSAKHIK